ncbi:helix-turn-helix domain-containing protein [Paenibacillus woosongensis]|uniref:Helix-turn-helix domain-containing protein n=1 Tax=Paenibacillus woosongensis TaxID=307580 RepID=A0A7X2Z1T0_9BACL|nr:helix-turn-helix domain-containing protein [Paenibacillus woosongensis]MUG45905.1 helix-turn-helix domain-containing protein [Paenibacillus woosongensis]
MQLQIHTLFQPKQANGRVASNKYIETTPSPILAPYVSCFWFSEPIIGSQEQGSAKSFESLHEDSIDRVLPDGCSDIIFEHDLKKNEFRTLLYGFIDEPFTITYDQHRPVRKFGIRFFPGGIYSLLGIPQTDFSNSYIDLDLVWASMTNEIENRIFEEPSFKKKVKIMEEFMISFLINKPKVDDILINNLLHNIFVTKGKAKIQELSELEVISTRQMNRIFYRWIGTSPKRFCEIVRFQAVINDITNSLGKDHVLAYDHGYFDQAHMIHDFKRFYGDSLSVAIREFGSMSDFYNQ